MAILCLVFRVINHFPFYIHTSNDVQDFQFSHILASTYYYVFNIAILGMKCHFIVGWFCISLTTNDVEHIFMCLLSICISSLRNVC